MDRIPIVIVGVGGVANSIHLPVWKNIKGVDVVAVCDINGENAERTAKNWKIPRVYTDFDKLLEEEKEAIVDLCTPPATHAPLSIKAMENGHHVLLEKPMAMSIEESEKILKEYRRRKDEVKLCVIHNFLFEPLILEIKSIMRKKEMDVLSVDIRMLHTPNDEMISDRNHWVHSLPGGRFGENLIHPVYLLRNLMGRLNVRDVYVVKRGSYDWVNYDELYATFDSGGKFGSIHISFNSPRWTMPLSVRIYGKELILNFDGTNLTLTIQGTLLQGYLPKIKLSKTKIVKDSFYTSLQILKSTGKNSLKLLAGKRKSGHENIFEFFVDSILEDKEMPYAPEEAYEANKTFLEVLGMLNDHT